MTNYFKTALLLGAMTGLIMAVGGLVGGRGGMLVALGIAAVMNLVSYWFSDKIVLKMHRAIPIEQDQSPELHAMVEGLCARAQMPKPRLYMLPQNAPNAFATGRNPQHGVVAVTQGLLDLMDREEVEGVIAHELAHIKNRDILISSIAATIGGAIGYLAFSARWSMLLGRGGRDNPLGIVGVLATAILAPLAATVIQMAVSRSREYAADATGAAIAGNPYGLANALKKLGGYSKRIPTQTSAATSHMFIVSPAIGGGLSKLFSTHPPVEERIRRLVGQGA